MRFRKTRLLSHIPLQLLALIVLLVFPSFQGCMVIRTSVGVSVATPEHRLEKPSVTKQQSSVVSTEPVTSFAFDVSLGLHFPLNIDEWANYTGNELGNMFKKTPTPQPLPGTWWFLPEMGFSLDHNALPAGLHAGFGISYTFPTPIRFGIGYIPSLIISFSISEQVEVGFRNSLYLYAFYFLSLELQWDLYPSKEGTLHNVRILAGVDLVPLFANFLRQASSKK